MKKRIKKEYSIISPDEAKKLGDLFRKKINEK
jgi:hypothetical protein